MTPTLASFVPNGNRILVELVDLQSSGTILIPESYKEETNFGKVIAVSPETSVNVGSQRRFTSATVGQFVLLSKYGRTEIVLDGKVYILVAVPDVLGFFN